MSLAAGTRVGPYDIVAPLGAGGMGEVYRARDTKLNRDVALKILPEAFAADPDRLARFRREAHVLASLNHPNIGHIYGFEDGPSTSSGQGGATYALVLELVEGPTLADRMAYGPLPFSEALPIATQIAEALEAAHEQGIVHRDLKPANVKVRDDGAVKVLDFGLAKAIDPAAVSSASAMNSPTMTSPALTSMGVILGTAAYMAPEQARGQPVDKRADIWAFGVVLYEMLTGRRCFEGATVSDVLAAVLRADIDWTALPTDTPRGVRRVLARCLERDPRRRLRDIGDASIDLREDGTGEPAPALSPVAIRRPMSIARWLPWAVAVAAAASAGFALARLRTPPPPVRPVTRAEITVKGAFSFLSLSRDGTRLVYTVASASAPSVAVRMLDQFDATLIPGSEPGLFPLLSPDGRWVAYNSGGRVDQTVIKKIPITGGASVTVCSGSLASGAAWGDDDTIVFSGPKGLMRVPAAGGTPQPLTTIDSAKGEARHAQPQFLPGGRQLLFTITFVNSPDVPQFAVLDLATGAYRAVAKGGSGGRFVASGHLTYVRGGTLFAVPFDLGRLTVTGDEAPIVAGVKTIGGLSEYSVSDAGLLVYLRGDPSPGSGTTLAWVNRQGAAEILPGQSRQRWGGVQLSPDGRRIAANIFDEQGGGDIWLFDVQRGTPTRLTFSGHAYHPIWTPDGSRVVYELTEKPSTKSALYSVPADGSGQPELLIATGPSATPRSFTADGRMLLYDQGSGPGGRPRIFVLPLAASGRAGAAHPLHDTAAFERDAQVSPDGRWVAYESNEAGYGEIYVQTFPGASDKVRISTGGGTQPRWARSGKELFYWGFGATPPLMAVEIASEPTFKPGVPRELFRLPSGSWDVTPDRDRLLVELTPSEGLGSTIATVTNWFEELRRLAPAKK